MHSETAIKAHEPWAQLLKRRFKIDVLKCDKCGGRMRLVAVVMDPPTIVTTLRELGLPVRAPPIAPARSRQLLDCSNSNDWTGADVYYGWPRLFLIRKNSKHPAWSVHTNWRGPEGVCLCPSQGQSYKSSAKA